MSPELLPRVVRAVQKGVRWLKETADSLRDARDIAITVSAINAAEKNPHSHHIQRLASTLLQRQSRNGSWNDELWDTTWAVRALSDVGQRPESMVISNAIRFVQAVQDPIGGTWYEEPFETMLVLDVLVDTAPELLPQLSRLPIRWLASLQQPNGCIIGIRYTGMAVSLFGRLKAHQVEQETAIITGGIGYIHAEITEKPIWTSAGWSNYYPLKALMDSGHFFESPSVCKAVEWYLETQESDGKWMQVSRIHDTAMSVLALSGLLTTPLVDLSSPTTGILQASKENGTIRVSFHSPGSGAITSAEKMKLSDQVRLDLGQNQQLVVTTLGKVRSGTVVMSRAPSKVPVQLELEKAGQYAYGHLIPARI